MKQACQCLDKCLKVVVQMRRQLYQCLGTGTQCNILQLYNSSLVFLVLGGKSEFGRYHVELNDYAFLILQVRKNKVFFL